MDWTQRLGMALGLVKPPAQPFNFPAGASIGGVVNAYGDMKMRVPNMQSPNVVDRRTSDYSAWAIPLMQAQGSVYDAKSVLGYLPEMPKMFADDVNAQLRKPTPMP